MTWLRIEGMSMWPRLRPGDEAALCAPVPPPGPGDVVVARPEHTEALVVHRVRERLADGRFLLRGDACARDDAPLPPERLVASVRRIRRAGRVLLRHEWDRPSLAPLCALARLYHRGVLWRRGFL